MRNDTGDSSFFVAGMGSVSGNSMGSARGAFQVHIIGSFGGQRELVCLPFLHRGVGLLFDDDEVIDRNTISELLLSSQWYK